ncbi:MAG: hypothetical protein R2779_05615 [Crocinitomicaceae bacterium]
MNIDDTTATYRFVLTLRQQLIITTVTSGYFWNSLAPTKQEK